MQGHLYQVDKEPLLAIPIFSAPLDQQKPLIRLVDQILAAKAKNTDVDLSKWEREIDQLVYKLYDLAPKEIAIIEEAKRAK